MDVSVGCLCSVEGVHFWVSRRGTHVFGGCEARECKC